MKITKEMILDWNGDATIGELANYLASVLNNEIQLVDAKKEISSYFEDEYLDDNQVSELNVATTKNSSSPTISL